MAVQLSSKNANVSENVFSLSFSLSKKRFFFLSPELDFKMASSGNTPQVANPSFYY
jgi:hypothetical protein